MGCDFVHSSTFTGQPAGERRLTRNVHIIAHQYFLCLPQTKRPRALLIRTNVSDFFEYLLMHLYIDAVLHWGSAAPQVASVGKCVSSTVFSHVNS